MLLLILSVAYNIYMASKVFTPKRIIVPIPDNIKSSYKIESNKAKSRFVHILLSAPGGQGKTTFIGTASRKIILDGVETIPDSNLLVIEYDPQGDDTLYDMKVSCDIVRPTSITELTNLVKWLHTSAADQYDVVALDPYNKMCDVLYDDVLTYAKVPGRQKTTHDEEILELRDYNRFYKRLRVLNEVILSLQKHIIFTCISSLKDKPSDMGLKKEDRSQIQALKIDGKMAHILSTQFSLHGIMEREGAGQNIKVATNFTLYNSESKTRFRIQGRHENLTFPDLLGHMKIKDSLFNKINWKQDAMGFQPELQR